MESWFRSSSLCIHILLPWFSSPLSFCLCLTFCLSLYPLLLLSSLHPPSAVSDHWWISYVTSRARCSRERGTTPQCWLPPPQMDGHPKTSTPPSCRAKTTAVSDESVTLKWQNLRKQIILITFVRVKTQDDAVIFWWNERLNQDNLSSPQWRGR